MIEPDVSPAWPPYPALFLDLDGTVLEFADHPQHVRPSPRLAVLLSSLPAVTHGAMAIVTGRPIADVDAILAPARLAVAGIHGLERRDAAGYVHAPRGTRLSPHVRDEIARFIRVHPQLVVEDKGVSFALHYRQAPELEPAVRAFVAGLAPYLPDDAEILHGQKVIEVKSRLMNKGSAIKAFMAEAPFAGRTPVFIGDDVTDEAGFAAVEEFDGVAVKVGAGATAARWRLEGVPAVLGWLEELAAGGVA